MAEAFEPRPEAPTNGPTELTDGKVAARRSWYCAAACCCGFLSLIVPIFAVGAFMLAGMGWKSRDRGLAIGGLVMASVAVVLAGFGFYTRYQAQESMNDLLQTLEGSGSLVAQRESAGEQSLGVVGQTVMMCLLVSSPLLLLAAMRYGLDFRERIRTRPAKVRNSASDPTPDASDRVERSAVFNAPQGIALGCGSIAVVVTLLVPPWNFVCDRPVGNSKIRLVEPAGYALVFRPPSPSTNPLADEDAYKRTLLPATGPHAEFLDALNEFSRPMWAPSRDSIRGVGWQYWSAEIDFVRLWMQLAVAAVLAGTLMVLLRRPLRFSRGRSND